MLISNKYLKLKLSFCKPDYTEQKKDRCLLVWKDKPYWMVVDSEFFEFLHELDGQRKLQDIINTQPSWIESKSLILKLLKRLIKNQVIADTGQQTNDNVEKQQFIPIENISINLTQKCNLRCKFCFNLESLTNDNSNELTSGEIIAFLEQTKKYSSKNVSLAILGGEPFMTPEKLFAVAKYGQKNFADILISTNGTLITKELAEKAKKMKLQVQVSIDGHKAKLHDEIRGKGSFKKTVEGIKILVESGVYTILSLVCHKGNIDYLENFYDFALKLGVNEARFIPLKMLGGALDKSFEPVPMLDLIRRSYAIFRDNPQFFGLIGRDAFSILANTCKLSAKKKSCGTGLQTLLLDADGSIYPCLNLNLPDFKVANIFDKDFSFTDVWENNPVLLNVRKNTTIDDKDNSCSKCPVHYWCLGGCKGETFINTGKLNNRAYNCNDLRKTIIETFWILSERPDLVKAYNFNC